jgi:plasmid stabilization system protein ParE
MQFLDGLRFIRDENPLAALKVRLRVEKALKRLGRFPRSGRRIPEFPELEHREVIVHPYRFFYRVEGKILWIVAVWHHAQLPAPPAPGRRG